MDDASRFQVCIVGGGFSGALLAIRLIQSSPLPLTITIVDKSGNFAKGVAYSTDDPHHLLNVPAGKMGAFADNIMHFYEWLQGNRDKWQDKDPAFRNLNPSPESFLPRKLYGLYLEHLLAESLAKAEADGFDIRLVKDTAHNADRVTINTPYGRLPKLQITLSENVIFTDILVLAVGNFPSRTFPFESALFDTAGRYIKSIWNHADPTTRHILRKPDLTTHFPDETIAIIGTGLTMVDAVLSLHHRGYPGKIIAISRGGKLSEPHRKVDKAYPLFMEPEKETLRIKPLYRRIRSEIRKAQSQGLDWRAVIDAMRPYTQRIWKGLNTEEKRKALEYFYSWWNVHRHRIPPESHDTLSTLIHEGKLRICAADIYHVGGKGDRPITIAYRERGSDEVSTLKAAYVINCSGPELDIAKSRNPLLLHMRDKGLISVGPLRAGIELNEHGRVKGIAEKDIYALGPLLVGELLETTAVPELRGQAKALADTIVARAQDVYEDRNIFI